jgi:hypothetical protein
MNQPKTPMHPLLLRLWLFSTASSYVHAWAGAILDHAHLDRFASVCEVVSWFSCFAAIALGIGYLFCRSDGT